VIIEHAIAIDQNHPAGQKDILREHHTFANIFNAQDHDKSLSPRDARKKPLPRVSDLIYTQPVQSNRRNGAFLELQGKTDKMPAFRWTQKDATALFNYFQ
jgi:hypothetical protein